MGQLGIGGEDGLMRFEGVHFFPPPQGMHWAAFSLLGASDESVWVVEAGSGLASGKDGKLTRLFEPWSLRCAWRRSHRTVSSSYQVYERSSWRRDAHGTGTRNAKGTAASTNSLVNEPPRREKAPHTTSVRMGKRPSASNCTANRCVITKSRKSDKFPTSPSSP
jgi:hypothetical protein